MTRILRKVATAGAATAAAAAIAVGGAGVASASVSGGYYSTITQCSRAGGNAVNSGGYSDFKCVNTSHNPPWHLVLYR